MGSPILFGKPYIYIYNNIYTICICNYTCWWLQMYDAPLAVSCRCDSTDCCTATSRTFPDKTSIALQHPCFSILFYWTIINHQTTIRIRGEPARDPLNFQPDLFYMAGISRQRVEDGFRMHEKKQKQTFTHGYTWAYSRVCDKQPAGCFLLDKQDLGNHSFPGMVNVEHLFYFFVPSGY